MTINCTRSKRNGLSGEGIFDEGTIALDVALGKYAIFLPKDSRLAEDQASVLTTSLTEVRARVTQLGSAFKCDRVEKQSGEQRTPDITATIPPGTLLTGGGCEVPGGPAQYGHNPPIYKSIPTGDGWRCVGGDPPNIPLSFSIRAYAIHCSLRGN